MRLSDFDYLLPQDLIAQFPLKSRDRARLLVLDRKTKTMVCDTVSSLNAYLPRGSTLVVNDSRVIPARLLGRKKRTGGRVEVFLLRQCQDGHSFEALLRPLRRIKEDDSILFNGRRLSARLVDRGRRIVRFDQKDPMRKLEKLGHMPLPPYIRRNDTPLDRRYYQTVFARHNGSVAAPTAGLHFTRSLLKEIQRKGHRLEKVTLHINYSTFEPVHESDITRHKMHKEVYHVNPLVYTRLRKDRREGKKVIAVGTTVCRSLETMARTGQGKGETDLFIYPGFRFKMVDGLLTNFHLPRSTLFMLVCAFGGKAFMKRAYRKAVREKFRFFSYGDCMLVI